MAEPQDIRRQVGDVQGNNYVQSGVVDNSTATLIGAVGQVGEGVAGVDAALAKKRFGESIEQLRTQYLTGASAAEAAASDGGAVDDGEDFVPTEQDNKALADFGKVLDQHAQAVAQGRRSQDMLRISGERLLRIAISKRPGLAREFREVAGGILGFDVVGSSIDVAARQDKEFLESQAAAAKSKAEQQKDFIKRQREVWEKFYPESAFVPDEQWAAYTATKMPHFMQMSQAAVAAQAAQGEKTMLDLQGKKSAEADERFYVTQMDGIRAGFDVAIDKAMAQASQPDESGKRLIDSPQGMRQVMTGLRTQLLANVSKVDQALAGRDIPADTKARYRALIDNTLTKLDKTLSLEDDAQFMEQSNNVLKSEAERTLLNSDEARLIAAMDNLYGDVVMDRFIKDNGKTLALTVSQVVTGSMPANQITKVAPRTVSQLVAGIWKDGSSTPPDPMATSRAAQDIATILSKFYLQDDSNFRPQDFTQWQGQKGILPVLTQRAKVIGPSLSEEEKGQIAAQGAAAAGNSALRLMSLLQKKSPSLVAKLDMASVWAPDTPGLAKPKAGQVLTPAEQSVLDHFGRQFNRQVITEFMSAYGGGDARQSWTFIAQQVKPTMDVKAQMTAEATSRAAAQTAQDALGGASGGGAGRGVQGPAVGAVEDGWRFLGGDPSSPSSWERVAE